MQGILTKKTHSYRVSIRKQQIEAYKKTKRKLFTNEQPSINEECINTNSEIYSNLLNHITPESLQNMDSQTFASNIQMLIEIVSTADSYTFKERFQPILCIFIEFFQYLYNQGYYEYTELLHHNPNAAENMSENIVKSAIFNKIFTFIEPNSFLKLICLIYYEILPQNLQIVSKTVILLRQLLSYSLTDYSVISQYLSFLGGNIQPKNKSINKSTVFLILLNITYSQSYQIMQIVFKQNLISQISRWVEQFGFAIYQKQVIAGIYGNCVEYLCRLVQQDNHQEQNCQEGQMNLKQSFLFLPLFEDLVKTQSKQIAQKLIFVSVYLLNTAKSHNLPCLQYLVELNQELVHNVVVYNEYYQKSEDLFILLSELYDCGGSITTLLDFLALILNKYTVVYYSAKTTDKNKENGDNNSNGKLKGLQNISKLIICCQNMLSHSQIDNQQQIFDHIIDFWCKEELFGLKEEIINFVTTALSANESLAGFVFDSHLQVVLQLMDQSYQRMNQIQAQLMLINVFLQRLDSLPADSKNQILQQNEGTLQQITVRLQDYLMRATKDNAYIFKLAEISVQKIEELLKTAINL